MLQNFLLILALDLLVINGLTTLRVDPTVERTALQFAVEVLDEAHHPRHLDATFNGEFSSCFHLPPSARATPWSNFCKASNNDDLLQVDQTAQRSKVVQGFRSSELGERLLEVGKRGFRDGLADAFSLDAMDNFVVGCIIPRGRAANVGLLDFSPNTRGDFGKVGQAVHATVEVGPGSNWFFDLRDTEQERMHETEDVERHLLSSGEGPHTIAFDLSQWRSSIPFHESN